MDNTEQAPELLRSWKLRASAAGVVLTINGHSFELGASKDSFLFDMDRAVNGWNGPEISGERPTDGL